MAIQNTICTKVLPLAILFTLIISNLFAQKIVRYDLYVKDTMVNFTGKAKRAIAVNGQIPMPTLIFTEGDTAEIYVHNQLNEETSLHWQTKQAGPIEALRLLPTPHRLHPHPSSRHIKSRLPRLHSCRQFATHRRSRLASRHSRNRTAAPKIIVALL